MTEIKRTDPELLKALGREAKSMIEERVFTVAVSTLRLQWYGELMNDATDVPKVLELVARLRALEAIPKRLESIAHDAQGASNAPGRR